MKHVMNHWWVVWFMLKFTLLKESTGKKTLDATARKEIPSQGYRIKNRDVLLKSHNF